MLSPRLGHSLEKLKKNLRERDFPAQVVLTQVGWIVKYLALFYQVPERLMEFQRR